MADEIVGRGSELAAVAPFLERGGYGLAALVLEGEAGIGKSTVWEAAARGRRSRGWLVRVSRPAQSEQGLTLGGLTDLLGGVGRPRHSVDCPGRSATRSRSRCCGSNPARESPDQRTLSVAVAGLLRLLAAGSAGPRSRSTTPSGSTRAPPRSSPTRSGGSIDRPVGLLRAVRTGAETPASTGSWRRPTGPARARRARADAPRVRCIGCSSVRLGRSFPRLVLVRIEAASRGQPAVRARDRPRAASVPGSRPTPHGSLPVPDTPGLAHRRGACRGCRRATRRAMLLAAAAAEPTVDDAASAASPGSRPTCGRRSRTDLVVDRRTASSGSPTRCSPRRW